MHRIFIPVTIVLMAANSFLGLKAQTITKQTPGPISGAVCPGQAISYTVSVPSDYAGCQITWSATNGTLTSQGANATVTWNDLPGQTATISATFSNCTKSTSNGKVVKKDELILSVKNQAWGSYTNYATIDYCSKGQVLLGVPRMYVQGTGGIAQPPLTEVTYAWTLPAGWRESGSNRTGLVGTTINNITIEPIECALPGIVTVYGTLAGSGPFCNSSANSATATISLNGANPVVSVAPDPGYSGASSCNTTPVTFYASLSPAVGCVESYTWSYPTSWQPVTQNANSITLRPSGTSADSGPIKSKVKFTCGTEFTSPAYTPKFNAPAISLGSGNAICSGGTTVTLTNVGNAQVQWTTSSNIVIQSGQGTTSIVVKGLAATTRDWGTIDAQVSSCPTAVVPRKDIWVGLPLALATYSDGSNVKFSFPGSSPDYNNICNQQSKQVVVNISGASSASWSRIAANPSTAQWSSSTYWSGGILNSKLTLSFFEIGQTATFRFTANNSCGSRIQDYSFKSISCSGGGCTTFAVSPNPSNSTIRIAVPSIPPPCLTANTTTAKVADDTTIEAAYLYTLNGEVVKEVKAQKKIKNLDLDISNLKNDVYILKIFYDDKVETHRIVKE